MKRYFSFNKFKVLFESLIAEGKHWPEDYKKSAINTIKNSPLGKSDWYSDDFINKDVDTIIQEFGPLSHKNSNLGYFATIIKWFTQYAGSDKNKYQEFIERKLDSIIRDLLWLSNSPKEEEKVKDDLKTKWSYADFEKYQNDIEEQRSKNLIDIKTEKHDYSIIPIQSYDKLHALFGGDKTGYKGKSEWCHTNGLATYRAWTEGMKNKFFVLARKDWEKILPPDPKTTNAYDDYGLSLIAILVTISSMKLKNATLRWNHIIEPSKTVPGTSVDHAFNSIEELNKLVGFDIIEKIQASLNTEKKNFSNIKKNATQILYNAFKGKIKNISEKLFYNDETETLQNARLAVQDLVIPDNIVKIEPSVFRDCKNIRSIKFGNKLKVIDDGAFSGCTKLESLQFPDSLEWIGRDAFTGCKKLANIDFGKGIKVIGSDSFNGAKMLEELVIPSNVETINSFAFTFCTNLKTVKIEDGVKSIGAYAFYYGCDNLKEITIPDSVTTIGREAIAVRDSLKLNCSSSIKRKIMSSIY